MQSDLISKSLIREFLLRNNLKDTALSFAKECPITQATSRIELISSLGIERIMKRNKESSKPFKTLLEVLVNHIVSKKAHLESLTLQAVPEAIEEIGYMPTQTQGGSRLGKMKKRPQSDYRPNDKSENDFVFGVKSNNKIPKDQQQIQEQLEEQPIVQQPQTQDAEQSQPQPQSQSQPQPQSQPQQDDLLLDNRKNFLSKQSSSNTMELSASSNSNRPSISKEASNQYQQQQQQSQQQQKHFQLKRRSEDKQFQSQQQSLQKSEAFPTEIQEVTEEPMDIPYVPADVNNHTVKIVVGKIPSIDYNKSIPFDPRKRKPQSKPILEDLNKLLFQGQMTGLPKSWSQGFIFSEGNTFFGLHQLEGGPCGVLACVQAYYLKHYLFLQNNYNSKLVKENCLMAALGDILYKINSNQIVLVVPSRGCSMNEAIPIDCCEQAVYVGKSQQQVYDILLDNKSLFLDRNGVTLFFYSVLLTKGVEAIIKEMDSASNSLIGNHGHCTQESVNLMLTGRASSNCFDGCKVLDGELELKGIEERSEIGFLTIFEHFQYLTVGQHLKEPTLPIWVICKEYHYSVIFGCDSNVIEDTVQLKTKMKQFDLMFYDGLNNHEDLIRLTIRRLGAEKGVGKQKLLIQGVQFDQSEQITPLIELVLRTKYGSLELDWNDSMPIL